MGLGVWVGWGLVALLSGAGQQPSFHFQPNEHGVSETLRSDGKPLVDPTNPFFQVLGTNGRSCATCHAPEDNFSVTPGHLQARFRKTRGWDPVFHPNDGTNSPSADRSTLKARREASSLLLTRGLFRIGIGMPAGADFELVAVDDPYGHASARELSLFRRPLPASNLDLVTVMQDGRETHPGQSLHDALSSQALNATLGHAQAAFAPTREELDRIVDYERHLFTAQVFSDRAGFLMGGGALGGPAPLSQQAFYPGINDRTGDAQTGAPFDPEVMTLFDAWSASATHGLAARRASVARGQALFNTRPIRITGVAGMNDNRAEITSTCSGCHSAPNVGSHAAVRTLDLGLSDVQPAGGLETRGLPVYTFRSKVTGEEKVLTDPGAGLITGRFADLGKFKEPGLRGLSGRAPYFHNGSARDLADVVRFYDERFGIGLSAQEQADLVAFLASL
jgi:cytochrome c peroxidase